MTSHICSTCGKEHEGLPTDYGFKLPDEVHALSYLEQYARTRANGDLCTLDERRYFIRGILQVPMIGREEYFGWGAWVEVDRTTHDGYVSNFNSELPESPGSSGRIANSLPGYSETLGLPVEIQFTGGTDRPKLVFTSEAAHVLAHEQHHGITAERHHEILENVGYFESTDT